jgi:hypothetical protein
MPASWRGYELALVANGGRRLPSLRVTPADPQRCVPSTNKAAISPHVRIVVAQIDPRLEAAMKDESGSIRTSIQGQGCGSHAAA